MKKVLITLAVILLVAGCGNTGSHKKQASGKVASAHEMITIKPADDTSFRDFSGETTDGKSVKLSDFVGQGRYVLVDFWASWCTPCKEEVPNIAEVYSEFHEKGLEIVGVNVWDERSEAMAAIKSLNMVWNHIITADNTATELYGIKGIPHIILFSPDGTIYKRGLRGERMKRTVSELFL